MKITRMYQKYNCSKLVKLKWFTDWRDATTTIIFDLLTLYCQDIMANTVIEIWPWPILKHQIYDG
jgi:hypothetical protein